MIKTRNGLPKYVSRNGERVRFRKRGFSTYLTGTPWSEGFMRQYAAALDGVGTNPGSERTRPGTFNALVVSYYRSPEFLGLRETTKADRRFIIESFRKNHGDKPLRQLQRAHVKEIIGAMADTPGAANNLLKVLKLLLNYAISVDMIATNPAVGVKRYPSGPGNHSWTEDEIETFERFHHVGSRARLALALLLYTCQRRSDVIRMGWQHVKGDSISVRQQKTGAALSIPIHPELRAILDAVPRTNMTFLMTSRGAPFNGHVFGSWFKEQCRSAGLPHCSAHGLRHSAATRLGNAGCTLHQIMAITGHKTPSEVQRYTSGVDQKRLAEEAMRRVANRPEEEQTLSQYRERLDKTGDK